MIMCLANLTLINAWKIVCFLVIIVIFPVSLIVTEFTAIVHPAFLVPLVVPVLSVSVVLLLSSTPRASIIIVLSIISIATLSVVFISSVFVAMRITLIVVVFTAIIALGSAIIVLVWLSRTTTIILIVLLTSFHLSNLGCSHVLIVLVLLASSVHLSLFLLLRLSLLSIFGRVVLFSCSVVVASKLAIIVVTEFIVSPIVSLCDVLRARLFCSLRIRIKLNWTYRLVFECFLPF